MLIRELQYYYVPIRMAKIPKLIIANADEEVEQHEVSFAADENAK